MSSISSKKMPWSKFLLLVFGMSIGLGIFSVLLIFTPPTDVSTTAIWVGVSHTILGPAGSIIGYWRKSVWGLLILIHSWMFIIYSIGLRALNAIYPIPIGWLLVSLGLYVLAWLLPYFKPTLSTILLREQMVPQTKFGKGCLSIALGIPTIAGGSAALGLYASRSGEEDAIFIVVGLLAVTGGLAGSQAFSHQIWEHVQMRKSREEGAEE